MVSKGLMSCSPSPIDTIPVSGSSVRNPREPSCSCLTETTILRYEGIAELSGLALCQFVCCLLWERGGVGGAGWEG